MAASRRRPRLTDTVSFDGIPPFRGLARVLADARRHGWHGKLRSSDRRRGVAERYGRRSQAALYAGWLARRPGFNPANPPGRSTHELRSDGVAYRGPVGRPLAGWQLGLDVSDADELLGVLRRLGYAAFRPYDSLNEGHHINLRRSPYRRLQRRRLSPMLSYPYRTSAKGVAFIAAFEGFRARPYDDGAHPLPGHATIGYGHLLHRGPVTARDQRRFRDGLTRAQARTLLARDLRKTELGVRRLVRRRIDQAQFDALVSFAFNVGLGALANSTLLRLLNAGHPGLAAREFVKWDRAGGVRLAGLTRRRSAERRIFQHAKYQED